MRLYITPLFMSAVVPFFFVNKIGAETGTEEAIRVKLLRFETLRSELEQLGVFPDSTTTTTPGVTEPIPVSAAAVHDEHEEDRKLKSTKTSSKSSKSKPTRRPTTTAPTSRVLPLPKLEARFGPLATDETIATYFRADGYGTVTSGIVNSPQISNSGALMQVCLSNELGTSQEEAERIAITLCEQKPDCTAVWLSTEYPRNKNLIDQNRDHYCIVLANPAFGPIRLNKQGNEDAAVVADNYLLDRAKNGVTFLKRNKPGIRILEVCNVPIEEDLTTAVGCVFNDPRLDEATCDRLVTEDFDKYIKPAVKCLSNGFTAPLNIDICLACITKEEEGDPLAGSCDTLPFQVCSEGVDKVSFFGVGGLCTDQCAEKCNAKVRTAALCSAGTRRKLFPVFSSCVETLEGKNTSNDLVDYSKSGECFVTGIPGLNDYTCPGPDFELDLSVYDVGGDVFTDIYGQKIDYEVFEFPLPLAPHNCDCSRNGTLSCLDCTLLPTLPPTPTNAPTDPPKSRSFTGHYVGLDSEDGTNQNLSIYCENALCDVKLEDLVFTTCIEETGNAYFGGVAIAVGIPEDSLDDFNLDLYCLDGQLEIDYNTDTPVTTLKGNMIGLEDGVIRRTGTGFTYFSNYRGDLSVNKPSVPKTGSYAGTDTEDGTGQIMNIYCNDGMCDVKLGDNGFSTCSSITGNPFYGGIAMARNVPEESLDNFKLDLYCLGVGETQFGNTPTTTLTGNMIVLKDGIISRTGPGFTFYLMSDKNGSTDGQIGTGKYWNNGSTTDGSTSSYDILCAEGTCDVVLEYTIFPACFALTGQIGGFAIAKIDQASFGNFSLDLYCAKGLGIDIDMENDQPVATIVSGLEVLEDGILLVVDSGNKYFNYYSGGNPSNPTTSLYPNGFYYGRILDNGLFGIRTIYCNKNKLCDIVSSFVSSNPCIRILQDVAFRPFNGVAIMKDVPQDSLDDFDIDLYCLAPAQQVDYGTTNPALTMRGGMIAQGNGIVTASDPAHSTYFIA